MPFWNPHLVGRMMPPGRWHMHLHVVLHTRRRARPPVEGSLMSHHGWVIIDELLSAEDDRLILIRVEQLRNTRTVPWQYFDG
jgi:hypothetical protein